MTNYINIQFKIIVYCYISINFSCFYKNEDIHRCEGHI